jgi:hypothetical protein
VRPYLKNKGAEVMAQDLEYLRLNPNSIKKEKAKRNTKTPFVCYIFNW